MRTRRSVLTGCVALLGTTALGGCSVLNSTGGGEERWDYRDWYPSSNAIDSAQFHSYYTSDIVSVEGLTLDVVERGAFGISPRAIEQNFGIGPVMVVRGRFSRSEPRTWIEEQGYTLAEDESYEGYQRFTRPEGSWTFALRGGVVVRCPTPSLEAVIDAAEGEQDRLVDTHRRFDLFTSELGEGHVTYGRVWFRDNGIGHEDAQVGVGTRRDFGPDESESTHLVLLRSEDDVDVEHLRDRMFVDDVDFSATVEGRFVRFTRTVPTDEV